MVGEIEGVPICNADSLRSSRFFVRAFQFKGVQLSWMYEGEADLLEAALGAPIDPEVLMQATSTNEALAALGRNASALLSVHLTACHARFHRSPDRRAEPSAMTDGLRQWQPSSPPELSPAGLSPGLGLSPPDAPPSSFHMPAQMLGSGSGAPFVGLDTLPSSLIQLILCMCGSSRAADALACVSRALAQQASLTEETREARAAGRGAKGSKAVPSINLFPVWSAPAEGSCPPSVVSCDARGDLLLKTARLGNSIVLLGDPVQCSRRRGALLEVEIASLRSPGGIQLGVTGLSRAQADAIGLSCSWDGRVPAGGYGGWPGLGPSEGAIRFWCDGAGRVRMLDGERCQVHARQGEVVAEGDKLGAVVFSLRGRAHLAFTINDALVGEPIALPERAAWRYFLRFDPVCGAAVRLVSGRRRSPLALSAMLLSARSYVPRPPSAAANGGALVLVRTVGPDSHGLLVEIEGAQRAADATVAQLARAVAVLLGCDVWHRVDLRIGAKLLTDGALRLSALGLRFDPRTGCQSDDILASLPHLIS